jgi:hypothetical protein
VVAVADEGIHVGRHRDLDVDGFNTRVSCLGMGEKVY